jgi:hypothetical protein
MHLPQAPSSEALVAEAVPNPVIALAEQIHASFNAYAAQHQQAQCLVLLDPALRDAGDDLAFGECLSQLTHSTATKETSGGKHPRILWEHPNLSSAHRPYLIALDLQRFPDAQVLQASVALALEDQALESLLQGAGHRICGWLFTQYPIRTLATHLGRLAVQRLPNDYPTDAGKRMLLRYFDPSVMPALWHLSDVAQQHVICGPVAQWIMLDRTGHLQSRQAQPDSSADGIRYAVGPVQIGYGTAQWLAVQSIGALNQVILQWQADSADGLPPSASQIEVATQALARARSHGIGDAQDLKAFAWHALTVHARFDAHPSVQAALQGRARKTFYTAAIAQLTEDDWLRIRHELNSKSTAQYSERPMGQ